MNSPGEVERGVVMPIQVYPLFESAIRAASGRSVDDHLVHVSELWARFSDVAAGNEHAWMRQPMSAEQIRTPVRRQPARRSAVHEGDELQQRRRHGRRVDHLLGGRRRASRRRHRPLGVRPRRVRLPRAPVRLEPRHLRPHAGDRDRRPSGTRTSPGRRSTTSRSSTCTRASRRPCSSVPASLGLGLDRQLTRTGGLGFAGGPWNNYVMHAIATHGRRPPPAARRARSRVGQRWLCHEALLRRLLDEPARPWVPPRRLRRTRSTPYRDACSPPPTDGRTRPRSRRTP